MMEFASHFPILSVIIPLAMALITAILGRKLVWVKYILSILASAASFILIVMIFKPVMMDGNIMVYWLGNWKPVEGQAIGIGLGIDQLSLFLALIAAFVSLMSIICSKRYLAHEEDGGKYYPLALLMTGGMIGFVLSGDLFNMYVMMEITVISAVSLTAFKSYKRESIEAGFKYIVISSVGSAFVLLGTIFLYSKFHTLNIAQIAASFTGHNFDPLSILALAFLLSGYAVLAFLIPSHGWAPDAHAAAPSSSGMMFSGALALTGVYALVRILGTLYQSMDLSSIQNLIIFWGVITMIIGVIMAMVQYDLRKMLAFLSISQIGFIITGFGLSTLLGITGGVHQMVNHFISISLLFICTGAVYFRTRTTRLNELGGLGKKMPYTAALFIAGMLSISGIPPFNGFISRWILYKAGFDAGFWYVAVIALLCTVLTLAVLIKAMHSVFFGVQHEKYKGVKEAPISMSIPAGILGLLSLAGGLFPEPVYDFIIKPVTSAVLNSGRFIDSILGTEYFKADAVREIAVQKLTNEISGYNPLNFLIVFGVLLLGMGIFVFLLYRSKNNISVGTAAQTTAQIAAGSDDMEYTDESDTGLFKVLKSGLGKYLGFMGRTHSGLVNDYSLWVVGTLAVVSIYLLLVL